MNYKYIIFEINGGYGFEILCEDNPIIRQEYMPDVDGYVIMTQEESEYYADIILKRVRGE